MHKIGIIGARMIGATTARLFAAAGHDVAVSNSRGPASLADLVKELGPRARAMTPADAARWAESACARRGEVSVASVWKQPPATAAAAGARQGDRAPLQRIE